MSKTTTRYRSAPSVPISEVTPLRLSLVLSLLGGIGWLSYTAGSARGDMAKIDSALRVEIALIQATLTLQDRGLQGLARDLEALKSEVRDAFRDVRQDIRDSRDAAASAERTDGSK